ncbi:hypothetical protein [Methylobacterium sp. MA0201]|uniref:hypothetical protein n=1 Tax=Methylobacterium alsaeris TaxID=3344826 RepID=UPI00375741BA
MLPTALPPATSSTATASWWRRARRSHCSSSTTSRTASAGDPRPDDGTEEGGLARAAILQKRIAALRDLAAAARLWIALERQAWDLDGKGQDKGQGQQRDETAFPDPEAAFRLLDEAQRAQLRSIAERLADRPAGPAAGPRPAR